MTAKKKSKKRKLQLTYQAVNALVSLFRGELRKGSAEEEYAYVALILCVEHWKSVDLGLRVWIRNMLDRRMSDSTLTRFEVVRNSPGVDLGRELDIAKYVDEQEKANPGSKKMSIYRDVSEKFRVSPSQVEKIKRRWKPTVEMLNKRAARARKK